MVDVIDSKEATAINLSLAQYTTANMAKLVKGDNLVVSGTSAELQAKLADLFTGKIDTIDSSEDAVAIDITAAQALNATYLAKLQTADTINLVLTSANSSLTTAQKAALIAETKIDSFTNAYTLTASKTTADEGSAVVFTVTSVLPVKADTVLTFNVQGDNSKVAAATAGTDFTPASGSVTLAAGASSATFTVNTTVDYLTSEGLEAFKVTLFDSEFNTFGTKSVVIVDNTTIIDTTPKSFALTTGTDTGTAFAGGAGADTFSAYVNGSVATLNSGDALVGGDGSDTLSVSMSGTPSAGVSSIFLTSIENISLSNYTTAGSSIDLGQATGVTNVSVTASSATGDSTITGLNNLVAASMASGTGDLTITYADSAVTGTTDEQVLTLAGQTAGAFTVNAASTGGVETVSLASGTAANTIAVATTGTTLKTVNVTGDKDLTLTEGATSLITINASEFTGKLKFTTDDSLDMSITGGTADDTITFSADNFTAADAVNGGAGTDTLSIKSAITASTVLAKVSNVEVLNIASASNVTLAASIAGLTTIDTAANADLANTVTFSAGYTAVTAVNIDSTDTVVNTANAAITVNATDAAFAASTVTGGTSTDTLNITASSASGTPIDFTTGSRIAGVDVVNIIDGSTAGNDISLTLGDYATALTIDASALDTGTGSADETLTVSGAKATKVLNITGGAGADTITGGAVNDIINGADGKDSIIGSAGGNDSINAGAGDDTINMGAVLTTDDTINGGEGTDILSVTALSSAALTNVTNVETLSLSGATSTATLTSNLSFTSIDMGSVDDTAQVLTLSTGYTNATTVSVDAGDKVVNTANVALTVTAVAADLQAVDSTTITGGTGVDTLIVTADNTTANIVATSTSTLITNVDVINVIDGGDVTTGTITAGKDITIDVASYATALTIDASVLDAGTLVSNVLTNDEVLTVTGTSTKTLNVTGGGGADTITGSSASTGDTLKGGDGNDTFTMVGNLTFQDEINGGLGTDTISLNGAGYTDSAFFSVSNLEQLSFTAAAMITLDSRADTAGITTVNGFGGDVVTVGGLFNNDLTYNLTSVGKNLLDGSASTSVITVKGATAAFNNASDIITGDTIKGGTGTADILSIQADNDDTGAILTGVSDFETITVRAGSTASFHAKVTLGADAFIPASKTLTINATALTDAAANFTFDASDITTATKAVNITSGSGADLLTGGAGADVISGVAGNDSINGGAGNDTIDGGAGNDSLTAGAGTDVLTGGAGVDTFKFTGSDSSLTTIDTITDLVVGTGGDSITLVNKGTEVGVTAGLLSATKSDVTIASSLLESINFLSAGDGSTNGIVKWFQFSGNTYLMEDLSAASTFVDGTDVLVKITGTVDLLSGTDLSVTFA
jgi:hypothetical protein